MSQNYIVHIKCFEQVGKFRVAKVSMPRPWVECTKVVTSGSIAMTMIIIDKIIVITIMISMRVIILIMVKVALGMHQVSGGS